MSKHRTLGPVAREAAGLLGQRVAVARRERGWTLGELAERIGSSETTARKIERGDPTVELGTAFEAAALTGVVLFDEDETVRAREAEWANARLAVLPRRVRRPDVDDDF